VFETLFKYPRVVARHRSDPFAEARERFLNHCVSHGLAGATVVHHLNQRDTTMVALTHEYPVEPALVVTSAPRHWEKNSTSMNGPAFKSLAPRRSIRDADRSTSRWQFDAPAR
jgi:hypothetical protein